MRFRLVDRWMQDMPRQDRRLIVSIEHLTETSTGGRYHARAAALERDLREAGIQYVIVWGRDYTVTHLMAALHLRPERVDGVLVYRVAGQQTSAKSHPSNTRLQTSHASPTNGLPRRARVTG
jgi:hypothetical protein